MYLRYKAHWGTLLRDLTKINVRRGPLPRLLPLPLVLPPKTLKIKFKKVHVTQVRYDTSTTKWKRNHYNLFFFISLNINIFSLGIEVKLTLSIWNNDYGNNIITFLLNVPCSIASRTSFLTTISCFSII